MEIKKIISHAKEYGFIFPSSDIYEGLVQFMITLTTE